MNTATAPTAAPPSITVHGHAQRFIKPDRVTFRFTLNLVAPSIREAEAALLQQRSRLLGALTPLLPAKRQVESTGLRLGPHHVYEKHRYAFKGFQATEALSLRLPLGPSTTRDILHAVADQLDSIELRLHYSAKRSAATAKAARTAAVRDAQTKATQFATAAGQQLGPLLRLTDDADPEPGFRIHASTVSESSLASDADTAPEAIPFTASIRVTWELAAP